MRRGRFVALYSTLACVVVSAVALIGGPAQAKPVPPRYPTIGVPGHAGLYGWGTAVETNGDILVSDYWNYRVQEFAPDGTFVRYLLQGSKGNGPGKHLAPYGLAVDSNTGDFYVGDVDGGQDVEEYDANGIYLRTLKDPAFNYPAYPAVAPDGDVYISDARANKIFVFDANGVEKFSFGSLGKGNGQFDAPRGIGIDANGNVYVNDAHNGRVVVFDATGTWLANWNLGGPRDLRGLGVDRINGFVYVGGAIPDEVVKYDVNGNVLGSAGSDGTGDGQFTSGPRGVAVAADGTVWVGDMGNFRAQQFGPDGTFLQQVPKIPAPPICPGFNGAIGLGIDASGDIFATDTFNQRVEKISPDGLTCKAVWGSRGKGDPSVDAVGFNYPRGLTVDKTDGSVIVGDGDNQRVMKFSNTGVFEWVAGGAGTTVGPVKSDGMAVAPDGTIYVTDYQKCRIVKLDASGNYLGQFGGCGHTGPGALVSPHGVAIDADGTLWVADMVLGTVQHLDANGAYLGPTFGAPGIGRQLFTRAWNIVVDATRVYVSDPDANAVKVWTKTGMFVRSYPQLKRPHGLDIEGNKLYVIEQDADRISVITIGQKMGR